MNLILRDATPVMARLRSVVPALARSPRRRRDRVERQTLRLLANLGYGDGRDGEQHGDQRHDCAEPVILLQDGDEEEVGSGAETTAALGEAEAGRAGVRREHLRREDLHGIAGEL